MRARLARPAAEQLRDTGRDDAGVEDLAPQRGAGVQEADEHGLDRREVAEASIVDVADVVVEGLEEAERDEHDQAGDQQQAPLLAARPHDAPKRLPQRELRVAGAHAATLGPRISACRDLLAGGGLSLGEQRLDGLALVVEREALLEHRDGLVGTARLKQGVAVAVERVGVARVLVEGLGRAGASRGTRRAPSRSP